MIFAANRVRFSDRRARRSAATILRPASGSRATAAKLFHHRERPTLHRARFADARKKKPRQTAISRGVGAAMGRLHSILPAAVLIHTADFSTLLLPKSEIVCQPVCSLTLLAMNNKGNHDRRSGTSADQQAGRNAAASAHMVAQGRRWLARKLDPLHPFAWSARLTTRSLSAIRFHSRPAPQTADDTFW